DGTPIAVAMSGCIHGGHAPDPEHAVEAPFVAQHAADVLFGLYQELVVRFSRLIHLPLACPQYPAENLRVKAKRTRSHAFSNAVRPAGRSVSVRSPLFSPRHPTLGGDSMMIRAGDRNAAAHRRKVGPVSSLGRERGRVPRWLTQRSTSRPAR